MLLCSTPFQYRPCTPWAALAPPARAAGSPVACSTLLRLPEGCDDDDELPQPEDFYEIRSSAETSERALYTLCLIAACHPSLEYEARGAERFVKLTAPTVLAEMAKTVIGKAEAAGEHPMDSSPPGSPAAAATPKLTIATSVRMLRDTFEQMKTRFRTRRGAQSRLTDFFGRVPRELKK